MRSQGIGLALLSAATFGTSGTFASSLLDAGWSPAAAVTVRVAVAALVLTVPALIALRGRWTLLRAAAPAVITYGLVAVAGCQLFFFNAVDRLSVGVALLLEYLGTIIVVGWLWARHAQRPRRLTVTGAAVAVGGLALVLDVAGSHHLDPIGVLWGLAAAVGLAAFFTLSSSTRQPLPPLVMAWAGLCVGAVALIVAGATGLFTIQVRLTDVTLAQHRVGWLVPVLGLSLVAAVIAYVSGIGAARLLGPKVASFLGLTEVVCAVLFAWAVLGQVPTAVQVLGGVLIVAGVVLVRVDDLAAPAELLAAQGGAQ